MIYLVSVNYLVKEQLKNYLTIFKCERTPFENRQVGGKPS